MDALPRAPLCGQQLDARLCSIQWGYNLVIITKAKTVEETLYYVKNTLEYGWIWNVLVTGSEGAVMECVMDDVSGKGESTRVL